MLAVPVGLELGAGGDEVLLELLARGDGRVAVGLEHEAADGDAGCGHGADR